MERRDFLGGSIGGGIAWGAPGSVEAFAQAQPAATRGGSLPAGVTPAAYANPSSGYSPFTTPDYYTYTDDLVIEGNQPGKPHQGKVLAAVQAHSDDIPIYAGGLVAKLIDEGYTGYLIRLSNDEASGRTLGYGVVQNEIDNQEVAVTDSEVGHRAGCGDEKRGFPVQDEMLVKAEPIFGVIRGGRWEAHGARV